MITPSTRPAVIIGTLMPDRMLERADRRQVLLVLRGLDEQLVRDLGDQHRLARPHHGVAAHRRVRLRRVALAQRARQLDPRRVGVRQRDLPQRAAVVGQLDRAPVGHPRDRERRDPLQRLLVGERRRERLAGLGQELLAQRGLALLGDVLDHVHREDLALLVLQRRRLRQQPAQLAGGAVDAPRQQRLGELAADHARAREVGLVERPAVRVADLEAPGQLARLRGEDRVHARQAEQPRGRLVGVLDAPVRVVDGDRLRERAEDAVEPPLRRRSAG